MSAMMETKTQPRELWKALQVEEDRGGGGVSRTVPTRGHACKHLTGAALPPQQKGSLLLEEIAELIAIMEELPASSERNVAMAGILISAAFGIRFDDLADRACAIAPGPWTSVGSAHDVPTEPGLLLYKPPTLGTWQGVMVLAVGADLPNPPPVVGPGWLHPTVAHAPIPLQAGLAARLAELIGSHPESELVCDDGQLECLRWPQAMFARDSVETVLAEARSMAPRLNCLPERISNGIHQALRERRVDPAIRGLLQSAAGRDPAIACYYTAIRLPDLCRPLTDVQVDLSTLLAVPTAPNYSIGHTSHWRFGSRRAPHRATTARAISAMDEYVHACRARPRDGVVGIVRQHNALVNQCAFNFFLSCGLRPSRNGLLTAEFDDISGSFTVADKGVPSRQLPMTDAIMKALSTLSEAVVRLYDIGLVLFDQQLIWHSQRMRNERRNSNDPNEIFSLLEIDEANRVTSRPWSPADLDACLGGLGIPVPVGLWRHALRTDLLELGVDPADIAAIMGHSQVGREPWASTSFRIAADHLPHVKAILERRLQWIRA